MWGRHPLAGCSPRELCNASGWVLGDSLLCAGVMSRVQLWQRVRASTLASVPMMPACCLAWQAVHASRSSSSLAALTEWSRATGQSMGCNSTVVTCCPGMAHLWKGLTAEARPLHGAGSLVSHAAGVVHLGDSLTAVAWALWAAKSLLSIAAGVAHLGKSLKAEAGALGSPVGIHTLSPGMVLTDLLLDGATFANKQIFNILCEQVGHCCAAALQAPAYVFPLPLDRVPILTSDAPACY